MIHEIQIKRWLFTVAAILFVSFLCVKAIFSGYMILKAGIIAAPLILYFINQPAALLMAMFLVDTAGLNIPGLWASVTLANLLQLLVVVLGVARRIINKSLEVHREQSEKILLFFLMNLVMVIYFRGLGLQVVGSSMMGGMGYVILFLAAGVYFFATDLRLNQRQTKFLIVANIVAGLLPAFVQIAFVLSGGRFYILAYFIQANLGYVAASVFSTVNESVSRLSSLREIGISLITVALVFKFKRLDRVISALLIGTAIIAVLLSGFRSYLLTVVITVVAWFFLRSGARSRVLLALLLTAFGVLAWLFLFLFSGNLPSSVLRTVSWVPGLQIPHMVLVDAQGSLSWRWEIWSYMIQDIPKYLLIGKGFCFPAEYLVTTDFWQGTKAYTHFLIHNYHSGPLSMLLDLGLPGFIFGTLWMISSSVEHIRGLKYFRSDDVLSRYYFLLVITYVWNCISFFAIYGDTKNSFSVLLLMGTLMRVIRYSATRGYNGTQTSVPRERVS